MSSIAVGNDTLLTGAWVVDDSALGVLGSEIPDEGEHGASIFANDASLPADANKLFRAVIVTPPASGALFVYNDGSFTFEAGADGVYTWTYRLYVDGVETGQPVQVTLAIGVPLPVEVVRIASIAFALAQRSISMELT